MQTKTDTDFIHRERILLMIPNLGSGGAQVVFRQQIAALSPRYEVIACVFNWDGAFEEDHHLGVVSLDVPGGQFFLSKLWYFILRVARLRLLKKEYQIKLTISHLEGADYVNLLSATTGKTICWVHGTKRFDQNISGFLGYLRKWFLIPFLYRRATQIVAVSTDIKTELIDTYGLPRNILTTINNGFDLTSISQLQRKPVQSDIFCSPTLVTHCRLAAQKNIPGLLLVMSRLIKKQKLKLLIIGDGELRNNLISLSRQLGLNTFSAWEDKMRTNDFDVYFIGYVSNPFPFVAKSSAYVMTSDWEGFPLALCEAMACGVPVISTDCQTGPREILTSLTFDQQIQKAHWGEYGVLMPLLSGASEEVLDEWCSAILGLLNDDDLRIKYAKAGALRVKSFDLGINQKALLGLVWRLLS